MVPQAIANIPYLSLCSNQPLALSLSKTFYLIFLVISYIMFYMENCQVLLSFKETKKNLFKYLSSLLNGGIHVSYRDIKIKTIMCEFPIRPV